MTRKAAMTLAADPADPADPGAAYRQRVVPQPWGWAAPGGGRAANVEGGIVYTGTTQQLCGLYPFAVASGTTPPGVPIGRHMHTSEPIGLDPAEWLRDGLVSNTGLWVEPIRITRSVRSGSPAKPPIFGRNGRRARMESHTITTVAAKQAGRAQAIAPTLDEICQARRLHRAGRRTPRRVVERS
jgi:hypothetical protein